MSDILLCDLSDAPKILADRRKEWVCSILSALGLEENKIQIEDLFELRNYLNQFGIHVALKSAGEEVDIYKREWLGDEKTGGWLPLNDKYLVAQWKRPKYVRRIDGNSLYYELHLNEWSLIK